MTSRELRTLRRANERQQRKEETKPAAPPPVVIENHVTENHVAEHPPVPDVSPALLEEFGADFIREANAIRDRVHGRIAQRHAARTGDATQANRSTGPRTPEGKAVSSQNSFKHGLASGQITIAGEDPAEFALLLADLSEHYGPANRVEELLVREMADAHWLMQRASRLQANCFSSGDIDTKALALFMRYRSTYERAFYKALNTLLKLQKESARNAPAKLAISEKEFVSQRAQKSPLHEHRPASWAAPNPAPGHSMKPLIGQKTFRSFRKTFQTPLKTKKILLDDRKEAGCC